MKQMKNFLLLLALLSLPASILAADWSDHQLVVGTNTVGDAGSLINGVGISNGVVTASITGSVTGNPTGNGSGLTNVSSTVITPAGDVTLTGFEEYVLMAANHAVTLGSATTNSGHRVTITSLGNGTNAILTVSSQTIAAASKWTNTAQYSVTCLVSDGTNWQLAGSRGN